MPGIKAGEEVNSSLPKLGREKNLLCLLQHNSITVVAWKPVRHAAVVLIYLTIGILICERFLSAKQKEK